MASSVTRAVVRRIVQGSPGPSRPLRLVPERVRRLADQFHRSDFTHESSTQENDNSIRVGDQGQNYGNINNQFDGGAGGSTAGDFNAGLAPVIQTTISTTINPNYNRAPRRFRARPVYSEYDYASYEYYDDIAPIRHSRPNRRRYHHPRRPLQTRSESTTAPPTTQSVPISKVELLQDLIAQGLLDPKDLVSTGYFSDNSLNTTEATANRKRRSTSNDPIIPDITVPDNVRYATYLSIQRDQFWSDVIPIMVVYELDFNIQVTISNEPIRDIFTPNETLQVNQLRNPFPVSHRARRSDNMDNDLSAVHNMNPNATSFIEIRNITRQSFEKTSFSTTSQTTHHVGFQALCICFLVVTAIIAINRFRHSGTSN